LSSVLVIQQEDHDKGNYMEDSIIVLVLNNSKE
jgi:hypothetical protein